MGALKTVLLLTDGEVTLNSSTIQFLTMNLTSSSAVADKPARRAASQQTAKF